MNVATVVMGQATAVAARRGALARAGDLMARHRGAIRTIQWTVVALYLFLVTVPAFLPLAPPEAHIWNNLTLFAQFLFWGIWWPFVMVTTMILGRVWCGVFCPEGTLTEFVSRRGLGRAIPRWLRWGGWPFVAFVMTTVFGQMVSVYQYPKAALLVLGGSTVAAIVVGFVYGRGKRVWCMYLCPANGVYRLLARLAPLHFRTDPQAWRQAPRPAHAVDCAPLINISQLDSASACHACGRCSGHRGAVALTLRSPEREILNEKPHSASRVEALTLLFGLMGVAVGAFQWSASPWFTAARQTLGDWLVGHNLFWPLGTNAPWWLLTHYPAAGDVFTWLDGFMVVAYIAATALLLGGWALLALTAAARLLGAVALRWQLALGLIPLGGIGVFLGLSSLTIAQLRPEGVMLGWVGPVRGLLLLLAAVWSARLTARLVRRYGTVSAARSGVAWLLTLVAQAPAVTAWVLLFWVW